MSAKKLFSIESHTAINKSFQIITPTTGEDGLRLLVDYDDVNHRLVDKEVRKLVRILNKYWEVSDEPV